MLICSVFAADFSPKPCLVFYGEVPESRDSCCNVFGYPLPAGGFTFLSEASWYERLSPFSQEIVDVVKTIRRMLFSRPPSASQQPRERASSLCRSRWEIGLDLDANPRSSQKSIEKHLLHSLGALVEGGFCCILSSTNPGNANVTCASSEHTVVNLS